MVYHSIIINVNDNSNNCAIDIYEKDGNSHQILFKLVDGNKFFNVSGYEPTITFYDPESKKTVITSAVTILNDYRGYLTYIIGESLLHHYGRYTVTLKLTRLGDGHHDNRRHGCDCHCHSDLSFTFIVNVLKDPARPPHHCDCNYEVAITKEFYDRLCEHLNNRLIHLSESDRIALNTLTDMIPYIVTDGGGWENDIVKVLTPREDFAELIYSITGMDPELARDLTRRVENLEDRLDLLLEVPVGEQPITNLYNFINSDYPRWIGLPDPED